jgi:guanylate kinase
VKKKKKAIYSINSNTAFDSAELVFYEEVCRLNKFKRKCIVLVGASGVGRRTLKQRLVQAEPEKFAGVIPHTSRPIRDGEINGKVYHFIHREMMEREIEDNLYLEYGILYFVLSITF